jgi:hypothetical protein
MALDATKIMNGTFGQVFDADGNWLTNVKSFEASVDIQKEEIKRAGTRWTAHKVTGLKGTGSINGYKVTTELAEAIGSVASDSGVPYVTELIGKVADPENGGTLRVRLKSVMFDKIDIVKFEVGSIIEEDLPFTFEGYEYLSTI